MPPKKERFELTVEERLDEAIKLKKEGTGHFSSGSWLEAQVSYHEASRLLVDELDYLKAPEGREVEARGILIACLLNMAMCALKREEWYSAEKSCTQAIERMADPMGTEKEQNHKALFRRAKARIGRSDFDGARSDVKAALGINPNSKEVRELWNAIKEREVSKHPRRHTVCPTAPQHGNATDPAAARVCVRFVAGEERGEREGGLRTDDDKARVQGVQHR